MRRCRHALPVAVLISLLSLSGLAQAQAVAQAAQANDGPGVEKLLRAGEDPQALLPDGSSALIWAAHHDNLAMAQQLLKAGVAADTANRYGITALIEAARNGNARLLTLLLDAGLDPDNSARSGETALMVAAQDGHLEAVQVLLKAGAQVNASEAWKGQNALMWAAAQDHAAVVTELLKAGAQVNAVSQIVDYRDLKAKQGSVKMNFPRGGFTPLLFAARNGALDAARVLIMQGADLNQTDPDGISALVMALTNFHFDVADLLISSGCDVNLADDKGRSALYAAVDMRVLDYTNRPQSYTRNQHDSMDIVRALLAREELNVNAQLTNYIPARAVLDGADSVLGEGTTALIRAARSSDTEVMSLLLQAGADIQLTTVSGANALMLGAGLQWRDGRTRGTEQQVLQALPLLLDAGLEINARDQEGNTALHGAAWRGVDEVIRYLVAQGADLHAVNNKGETPLDVAKAVGGIREPLISTIALLESLNNSLSAR